MAAVTVAHENNGGALNRKDGRENRKMGKLEILWDGRFSRTSDGLSAKKRIIDEFVNGSSCHEYSKWEGVMDFGVWRKNWIP